MLRACRRVLRPGGRAAFYAIHVARGLAPRDHRRAVRAGPRAVDARGEVVDLVRRAGFADVRQVDATAEYLETARAWWGHARRLADELVEMSGPDQFEQMQSDRAAAIRAIEQGLLRRSLFVGTRSW